MSLLLLFGGAGGPVVQAGYYSPVAFWMGGAGSPSGAKPWLYRSHTVTLGAGFVVRSNQ